MKMNRTRISQAAGNLLKNAITNTFTDGMGALMAAFRALKPWQIGVLVTILVGAAGAAFGVYSLVSGSDEASLAGNQQLIPVQRGNLVNHVSTNGSIVFPNRETLAFDVPGTVGDVFVAEGQQVEEGQELARLDQSSGVSLESSVAMARLTLRDAEEALQQAKDPHTALEIARAEANVANARLSLQEAQVSLDSLLQPSAGDMAQAEAAVANARLSLKEAQDDLAALIQPPQEEIAKVEAAVTNAKISAEAALDALVTLRQRPSGEEIADAQSLIDSEATALAGAEGDLHLARKDWDAKVETAQDSSNAAFEGYQTVFQKWLGIDPPEVKQDGDPDTLLNAWGADLGSLFNTAARFQDLSPGLVSQGPPPDDPDTPWSEVVVYLWANFHPSEIVPTCEDGNIDPQTLCVRQEMDDAWDTLQSTVNQLDTVEIQAAKAIGNAEQAVIRAQESLAGARDLMAGLELDPDPLEVEGLEKQLAVALATLQETEDALEEINTKQDSLEFQSQDKKVALAQASLDDAEQELSELLGGPDPLEAEAQRMQVAVNQADLDQAGEDHAELVGSVDPLEVSLREAEVASAQLALDTALQQLEGRTLMSPMDGVVSLVNVEAGQEITTNTRVIEVVDTTVVEVDGIVDEIDVLFVQVGARTEVIMDALPGQVLEGTVTSIASAGQNQQGVVTYPISTEVRVPEGVQLVEGLSAAASIILREDIDVLLVPTQAIYGTFEQPVALVMSNGSIREQPVALGNSDGFWIVVTNGLQEGDLVAIETAEASTDPFAQFRQQIQSGTRPGGGSGGFGGGGRP